MIIEHYTVVENQHNKGRGEKKTCRHKNVCILANTGYIRKLQHLIPKSRKSLNLATFTVLRDNCDCVSEFTCLCPF